MKEIRAKVQQERQLAKELAELRQLAKERDTGIVDDLKVLDTLHSQFDEEVAEKVVETETTSEFPLITPEEEPYKPYGKHAKPVEFDTFETPDDDDDETPSLVVEVSKSKKNFAKYVLCALIALVLITGGVCAFVAFSPTQSQEQSQVSKEQQMLNDFNSQFEKNNELSDETGARYSASGIQNNSLMFDIELDGTKNNINLPLSEEQEQAINASLDNIANSYHLDTLVNTLAKRYGVDVNSITIRFYVNGVCVIEKQMSGQAT